jgi:hypothetical protein
MSFIRNILARAGAAVVVASAAACHDAALVTSPAADRLTDPAAVSNGATRTTTEFDFYQNADFFLACLGEMTHWEGPVRTEWTVITTPTGSVMNKIYNNPGPTFYMERPNGVRYYARTGNQSRITWFLGPVEVVAGAEPTILESASGERLVLSIAWQFVMSPNGDTIIDWQFVGVCP